MDVIDVRARGTAAGDVRLIRDDDEQIASRAQRKQRVGDARKDLELRNGGRSEEPTLGVDAAVDHAIPVKKNSSAWHAGIRAVSGHFYAYIGQERHRLCIYSTKVYETTTNL